MPRKKGSQKPAAAAQLYISQHLPELRGLPLRLRALDGPPGAPRYAATLETCLPSRCPRGFAAGACDVLDCPLRHSARLLLDRDGAVVQVTLSGVHWN